MIEDLIKTHGTDSQRERHAAGRLPLDELRDLVRGIVFAPMEKLERFRRLETSDIRHGMSMIGPCGRGTGNLAPTFSVVDHYKGPMTEHEWERWKTIQARFLAIRREAHGIVKEATLVLRQHTAKCDLCGKSASRLSALVTIEAGELNLSREYAV